MKRLSNHPLVVLFALIVLIANTASLASAAAGDQYPYNQPGDKNYMTNSAVLERTGANNYSPIVTSPRAQADATFTTAAIAVDGVREAAWDAAITYPIANKFNTTMTATAPTATAQGLLRLLWNGPVLYALVEVTGDSTKSDTGTPNWSTASYTPNTDGLFVFMDVFNDQWGMETDTQGVFFLGANPALTAVTSFNNGGIPSLGSFFNPNNMDYSPRLKAFKSSGYVSGAEVNYTYEIALQIEGWGDAWNRQLVNGEKVGLEVAIFNQGSSFTYWNKTDYTAGREGSSNVPNSERVRNRDWGVVSLASWDGVAPFAYSGWRADEDIRFWNSKSNPGGTGAADSGDNSLVWTPDSKARMVAAKVAYLALKNDPNATRAQLEAAVLEVCQAFAGLRWANTKYPDPHDLPVTQTLPNVWKFFDQTKGTDGMVTNPAEWTQRKQEIRDLAQFYEYGYKPRLGVDYTVEVTTNAYSSGTTAQVIGRVTPTNVNYTGGTAQNVTINVTLPASTPNGGKAAVGIGAGFTAYGFANINWPTWGSDVRTDSYAWGTRTGTFYTLFPYARNSTTADSSVTIGQATAVSVFLDILEAAVAANPNLAAKIDPTKAITKGFSFQGKYAFVAGVFDERVKAVIAGGAGATGPANWRYNVQGQSYSITNVAPYNIFYNVGADAINAHGTEGPGNSYRHNRVRETEMFRHFMPYGHLYNHEEGSYAYGGYGRLPFDNASLVATFAPDRAIIIDTNLNDYNDGAVTDNMSLEVAKYVYKTLGVNPDNYVKFNSGSYVSSGDPHGAASATPEGHFLSDLFYGTATLTPTEAARLNTDPYSLPVANGQTETPYDYYWGGFNTITGGTGGVYGTGGWYNYSFTSLALTPVTVQYSDQAVLTAAVTPFNVNGDLLTGSVTFFINGGAVGAAPVDSAGQAQLTIIAPEPPGSYTVTASFASTNPNFTDSSAGPATLTVIPEDARAFYNGNTLFWTAAVDSTTADVTLSAAILDATADPALDPYAGDITHATVTFVDRNTDTPFAGCENLPVGLVDPNDAKTGMAVCVTTLDADPSTGASQYTVGIVVSGGYYARNAAADNTIITVAQPLANFITGGGRLVLTNSAGSAPGDPGSTVNFGFNVKYNQSRTDLRGHANVIVRSGGHVYYIRLRSTGLTSLGITDAKANFTSKAVIYDVTDPRRLALVDANAVLQLWMTDNTTGRWDTLGIQVLSRGGALWFSSNWDGTRTVEQVLDGGNLSVH